MTEETIDKPFWITPPLTILFDLVRLQRIQPWNVDVAQLLPILVQEMRKRGHIDFTASGIALLSSATLLKIKSEHILELEEPPKPPAQTQDEFIPPPIQLPFRYEFTSTTIQTLITALEELLETQGSKLNIIEPPPPILPESFQLPELDDFIVDIENRLDAYYSHLLILFTQDSPLRFSALIENHDRIDIIHQFILLLFLASRGRLYLEQNDELDDILLRLPPEDAHGIPPEITT
jgi:segregation and condensation protein A